jgi:methylthioribose-1-phosphate isomerase
MRDLESLSLRRRSGKLEVLDQTRLPGKEEWLAVPDMTAMIAHIQRLAVRGAPLIGVAAALSLSAEKTGIPEKAEALRRARPTAVNLMNAMDRMLIAFEEKQDLVVEAEKIFFEDVDLCHRMSERAASFLKDGDGLLTHCNTGGLATVGVGTALGAIRAAHESGKKVHVYVDETRPLLQGARLTAWELGRLGIPYTLICDNMAAALMRQGKVQHVLVGADRIAVNGDVANKIGTYGLAVAARHHKIPFMVVAPSTTLDPDCRTGKDIPIEERGAEEVRAGKAPAEAHTWNPAFDVTPRDLIDRIVLEDRLFAV